MFSVTADPTVAFVDAVKSKLSADATLVALVTGIYGYVPEASRTAFPYVVLGRRLAVPAGAMQLAGSMLTLHVDVWSDAKGPYEATAICSHIYRILERQAVDVSGFALVVGSLTRVQQQVVDEPDIDNPNSLLFHGSQEWTADLEESV